MAPGGALLLYIDVLILRCVELLVVPPGGTGQHSLDRPDTERDEALGTRPGSWNSWMGRTWPARQGRGFGITLQPKELNEAQEALGRDIDVLPHAREVDLGHVTDAILKGGHEFVEAIAVLLGGVDLEVLQEVRTDLNQKAPEQLVNFLAFFGGGKPTKAGLKSVSGPNNHQAPLHNIYNIQLYSILYIYIYV